MSADTFSLICFGIFIDNIMSGLTKEQLDKFEKDGILVVDNFLSPDEVTAIRFDGCFN